MLNHSGPHIISPLMMDQHQHEELSDIMILFQNDSAKLQCKFRRTWQTMPTAFLKALVFRNDLSHFSFPRWDAASYAISYIAFISRSSLACLVVGQRFAPTKKNNIPCRWESWLYIMCGDIVLSNIPQMIWYDLVNPAIDKKRTTGES